MMLRTEAELVKRLANNVAERAVRSQVEPLLDQIQKLTARVVRLEKSAAESPTKTSVDRKGKSDGKL